MSPTPNADSVRVRNDWRARTGYSVDDHAGGGIAPIQRALIVAERRHPDDTYSMLSLVANTVQCVLSHLTNSRNVLALASRQAWSVVSFGTRPRSPNALGPPSPSRLSPSCHTQPRSRSVAPDGAPEAWVPTGGSS